MPSPRVRHTLVFSASLVLILFIASCSGGKGGGYGGGGGGGGTPAFHATINTAGNFSSNEMGATYTIIVQNTGNGATSGPTTVVDPPTGFTVTAMSGTGWSCTVSTSTTSCTYSASVPAAQSFPVITVTGNVTAANGGMVSIALMVSGGGAASVTSSPTVSVAPVALSISKSHTGNFTQGEVGATYSVIVSNGAGAGATGGTVTVTEIPPTGLMVTAMAGTNWLCAVATFTCTRSDSLAGGSSYDTITVTVTVSTSAPSSVTNQASVSGGNQMGSVPNATDPTTVSPTGPDLSVTKTQTGSFTAGTNSTFTIAVKNVGTAATTGTITVSDTLNAAFTFVSGIGTGWTCGVAAQLVTCTNPGPIASGASAGNITLTVAVAGTAAGQTISNTATVSDPGDVNPSGTDKSSTVTITITSCSSGGPNAALVSGDYSFYFQGFNAPGFSGFFTAVGKYHADGVSTLSNGLVETNGFGTGNNTGGTPITFTGCFTVGADKRGTMSFTNSSAGLSVSLAISVKANGEGFIISFNNGSTRGSGQFKKMTGPFSNSSVSGDYAYGWYGLYTAALSPGIVPNAGAVGHFHANGTGGIPEGLTDISTYFHVITASGGTAFSSPSYSVTDTTNGRIALTFTITVLYNNGNPPFASQTQTYHFVCYPANGVQTVTPIPPISQMFCMGTDTASVNQALFVGPVLRQSTPSGGWTNSDTATAVFYTTGIDSSQTARVQVGVLSFNNTSLMVTQNGNENKGGTLSALTGSANYGVTSATGGRVAVTVSGADFIEVYLVDIGSGFLVDTANNAAVGFFQKQETAPSGGFTTANFNNTFAAGTTTPGDTNVTDFSAYLTSNGTGGNLTGTEDINTASSSTSSAFSATYAIANGDASIGRITVTETAPATDIWILIIIDANNAVAIPFANSDTEPAVILLSH